MRRPACIVEVSECGERIFGGGGVNTSTDAPRNFDQTRNLGTTQREILVGDVTRAPAGHDALPSFVKP